MTLATIASKFYLLTKTNSTSVSNANLAIYLNTAYERVTSLIMTADGRWEWEDDNKTDLPIATSDLVAGQQDYALSVTHLQIVGVSVKDANGTYRPLTPINWDDIDKQGIDRSAYQSTNGMPNEYDKVGSSIFLYPAPASGSVTTTAGLKIYFKRGPTLWSSSDISTGTAVPGFNSLYHDLIPLWAAYDYAIVNLPAVVPGLFAEIERKEKAMLLDYNMRNKDERAVMTAKPIKFR